MEHNGFPCTTSSFCMCVSAKRRSGKPNAVAGKPIGSKNFNLSLRDTWLFKSVEGYFHVGPVVGFFSGLDGPRATVRPSWRHLLPHLPI